jgi:phosphatidylglycerophosphatase A
VRSRVIFFATGFGSGFSPFAPGTAGSVVGAVLVWLFFAPLWQRSVALALIVFAILFAASCWISGEAERIFNEHDSPKIVIDEVMGMAATMFLNPLGWPYLLAGFLIFRLFDIIKPPPAHWFDREIGGGGGVMLDDLAAAIYANLALRLIARLV